MIRLFIILLILVFSLESKAHNPDASSTLLVEQSENKWVVQIRAALTAFEYEIENHFGASAYATPEEFQQLVIQHVQERIAIQFNENVPSLLQNGTVNLGHETSISFDISEVPLSIQSLKVKNSSFSEIPRNQNALMVIKKGFAKDQFTLDNNNEHKAYLKVANSKFELISPMIKKTSNSLYFFGATFLFISIMILALKKYHPFKHKLLSQNSIS